MVALDCKGMVFENIAAVLWDKDGTLADSHPFLKALARKRARYLDGHVSGVGTAVIQAFGCHGDRYDPTGLMAVGTRYENEIAAAAYVAATGIPWAEAIALAKQAFIESDRSFTRKADFTPPFQDIAALLKTMQDVNLKQAVLSGDTTANIQDFLTRYEFTDCIKWCAGSEAPPIKPDPQMVWTACDKLSVLPENCLVIGDSHLDYQLAEAGGTRGFVSVTWGGSPAITGAIAILNRPSELQIYENYESVN